LVRSSMRNRIGPEERHAGLRQTAGKTLTASLRGEAKVGRTWSRHGFEGAEGVGKRQVSRLCGLLDERTGAAELGPWGHRSKEEGLMTRILFIENTGARMTSLRTSLKSSAATVLA
jgi:hypothetical protein